MTAALQRALHFAEFSLLFSRVNRITRHPDGIRSETDSDHTIMLALIACELAPAGLDRGRVAQFALVHDLVEAYAGDTPTLAVTPEVLRQKEDREWMAMERIESDFGQSSWVVQTMQAYENQEEPEARYVRLLDKVAPKLTHILNRCAAAKEAIDFDGFIRSHRDQMELLQARHQYDPWAKEALELLADSMAASEWAWEGCICKGCTGTVVYESPTGTLLCQAHLDEAKAEAGGDL